MCARCDALIAEAEARGTHREPVMCKWVGPQRLYPEDLFAGFPSDEYLAEICEAEH